MNYFNISELCIDQKPVPLDVANKLLKHHIMPMNVVREIYGGPIYASQRSGYRSYEWEKARGRSGRSQHVFRARGAVDWTGSDLKRLFVLIYYLTDYTRIAYYPSANFIHCDYAAESKKVYLGSTTTGWRSATFEDIINL